jgi:hypothetical protein
VALVTVATSAFKGTLEIISQAYCCFLKYRIDASWLEHMCDIIKIYLFACESFAIHSYSNKKDPKFVTRCKIIAIPTVCMAQNTHSLCTVKVLNLDTLIKAETCRWDLLWAVSLSEQT